MILLELQSDYLYMLAHYFLRCIFSTSAWCDVLLFLLKEKHELEVTIFLSIATNLRDTFL